MNPKRTPKDSLTRIQSELSYEEKKSILEKMGSDLVLDPPPIKAKTKKEEKAEQKDLPVNPKNPPSKSKLTKQTIPSTTIQMAYEAMGNFLASLFPKIEIIQSQSALVAPPKSKNFIVHGIGSLKRLATNKVNYIDREGDEETPEKRVRIVTTSFEVPCQIDFYGDGSSEMASTFIALFFDNHAYNIFPKQVKPLWVTDAQQITFPSMHQNYSDRWRLEASLQINTVIETPMEFFTVESAINRFETTII